MPDTGVNTLAITLIGLLMMFAGAGLVTLAVTPARRRRR